MGTTFVSLSTEITDGTHGFWMRDSVLELWLRLLALHLPEPDNAAERELILPIRNEWLLASRYPCTGAVNHGMEKACGTRIGRAAVRKAIESLASALDQSEAPLDANTLNLLAVETGVFEGAIERVWLKDVAQAFLDLLDSKVDNTVESTEIMPGSKPYKRDRQ